jgi:hypothetical protein
MGGIVCGAVCVWGVRRDHRGRAGLQRALGGSTYGGAYCSNEATGGGTVDVSAAQDEGCVCGS